ncbi:Hsp33 family molecular chaperone HslO [Mesoplasma photuris]|uniref:Hsp33 family molecular chaperone HslO n=1 Tax=Mesoplasma photuris TaxID=217731 RepID=UPI001B80A750|nr:Hsp33 family molecular chaperone HslO [Mesoplasma photuris]
MRIRGISSSHNAKISIVDITESMIEITKLQNTNPLVTVALSRFTAANCLVAMELKNSERMTTNLISEDGLVKKMIAEFQDDNLRAFAQNRDFDCTNITSNPIKATVGECGNLIVKQDLHMRDPYISHVDLINGSIDKTFMNYFKSSNQVKSFIKTTAILDDELNIKKVVGILVQLLPTHTNKDIDYLEEKMGNSNHVAEVLTKSTNYASLIVEIIEDAIILEQRELKFACTCSEEKVIDSIKLLGEIELQSIIDSEETINVVCEFCNREFSLTSEKIKELI